MRVKYKNGTKLKLGPYTNVLITSNTGEDHNYFGIECHYGVMTETASVGQPTTVTHGWMPAILLDNLNVVELS